MRLIMGTAVTALFAGLLFVLIDWSLIGGVLARVDLLVVLFAAALMALTQVVRALRMAILLDVHTFKGFFPIFRMMTYYNIANLYLPMRLGELVFIWLIRRTLGQALSESIGIFLLVRTLDALALVIVAAMASWTVIPTTSAVSWLPHLLTVIALLSIAILVGGATLSRRIEELLRGFSSSFLTRTAARILSVFSGIDRGKLRRLVAATAVTWICITASSFVVIQIGLGRMSIALAAWASAGSGVSFMLPVSGLAGIGPFEAATIAAMAIADIPRHEAAVVAIVLHAVVLVAPLILLPFALASLGIDWQRTRRS